MLTNSPKALVIASLLVIGLAIVFPYQHFNPYLPGNVVAAEPFSPYNHWMIPPISRTAYPPCPSCGPVWAQFPDIPPVWSTIRGPFMVPVQVP
jgi:hypothetical protein